MNMEKTQDGGAKEPERTALEKFRENIAKNLQRERSGELGTAHFFGGPGEEPFKPEELTEEDREMYETVESYAVNRQLRMEDFDAYKESVLRSGNLSRQRFYAFLANRLAAPYGMHQLEAEAALQEFRREVSEMKEKETSEALAGGAITGNLFEVNPDELIAEDADWWRKMKKASRPEEVINDDFARYVSGLLSEGNHSRKGFLAMLKKQIVKLRIR